MRSVADFVDHVASGSVEGEPRGLSVISARYLAFILPWGLVARTAALM
jgi:hypothetical protein